MLSRAAAISPPHPAAPLAEDEDRAAAPLVRLAQSLRAAGEAALAASVYEAALEIDPLRPEALLGRGALLIAAGELAAARALLTRCCEAAPRRAEAWDALGVSLLLLGEEPAAAVSAFAEAQRLAPGMIDYALHRAEAAFAAGAGAAELAGLQSAAAADPLDIASIAGSGLLLFRLGRLAEAADTLEAAAALRPDAALPAVLLGRVLATLGRAPQAEAVLDRAIALDPTNAEPRNDRAAMLMRMQRHGEAHDALVQLAAMDGGQPAVLCNLANAQMALGRQDQAVRTAEAAVALAPDAFLPWRTLCNTLPYRDPIAARDLLDAARECGRRLRRGAAPARPADPDPERRLRVGLLSGSLKVHPVGWLTIAGFEALEPGRFAIVCLAQDSADDAFACRFRAVAEEWHDVSVLDDAALAAHARALSLDMLIDLGGYGEAGRMSACALRLAPVQLKWVGMQNHSTGLPEMDWFITDRWETPPGFEDRYSERLLRLPDGYVCYSPPAHSPEVAPLPALANGFVTFGCFNNLAKLTPAVIETWARILHGLPSSRLVLKTHQFADPRTRARTHEAFALHGVAAARIELQGASPHREFLAEYRRIDLALDPFPYCGGLTTCEALWMGVPVVSLPGEIFAARHSASHLCNVGLDDWLARDREDYVALARAKASGIAALAVVRAGLRERMRVSPLCDGPRFGRNLGAALREAWRAWCLDSTADSVSLEAS